MTAIVRHISILWLITTILPGQILAQYHVNEIQLPENLAGERIHCQFEASNGIMFFGTSEGLYRYDGWRFERIPGDQLTSQDVTSIYEAEDHSIWIGTGSGAIGLMDGLDAVALKPWEIEEGHPGARISGICQDQQGILWIATYGEGVYAWTGHRLYNFNQDDGLPANEIYRMVRAPDNGVWVSTDLGLAHCSFSVNKKWIRTVSTALGLPDNIIPSLYVHGDRIWYGTFDQGVGWIDVQSNRIEQVTTQWTGGSASSLLFWEKDHGFVGTATQGLWEMQRGVASKVHFTPGLSGKQAITHLVLDQEGMMWMIVNEQYIYTFLPSIQHWDHGLGEVQSMLYLSSDSICLGKSDGLTLAHLDHGPRLNLLRKALPGANVISLYHDAHRNIYAGTFGQGVYVLDSRFNLIAHWDERSGLLNGSILSITSQSDYIWLATLAGISRIRFNPRSAQTVEITNYTKADGLPSNYIYQVFTDHRQRLWLATDGAGVSVMEQDTFLHFPTVTLAGPDGADTLPIGNVYSITEDGNGRLWMNTASHGVIGLDSDGRVFEQIDRTKGLRLQEISTLAWSGTHLIMVDRDGMEVFHPKTESLTYLGETAGLKDLVLNLNAGWNGPGDGVWFVSNQSLFHYQEIPASRFQPIPVIKDVRIINEDLEQVSTNQFRYNQNHLRISYAGIWNSQPQNILFAYRILGSNDTTWRRTRDHQAFLWNLDPGTYEFQIKASVHGDFASCPQTGYAFVINNPYWFTWWFIAFLAAMTFALLYLFVKWRERVVNQRSMMEKQQVEAELATIKNQINPHFLFNSFNTLAATIEENREEAIEYVEHLADFYRKILLYGEIQKISLSEELSIVDEYCSILKYRYGDHLIINKKQFLPVGMVVPMTLQRLVENAIKHNEISRQKPLTITIYLREDYIGVSNPVQVKWTREASTGFGLESIRKQYRFLTSRQVHVREDKGLFTVEIPILNKE